MPLTAAPTHILRPLAHRERTGGRGCRTYRGAVPTSATPGADALIGVALGRAIRSARTERSLSMRALAASAEISQPFLSQIESGQTMPSVVTLFRLAKGLGISPSELLPSVAEPEPIYLTRAADAARVRVMESDERATSRVLSSGSSRGANVQEYQLVGPYLGDWFESDGEITSYVVDGRITVTIEGRGEWELGAGDAIWHPGALRNRWSIADEGTATVLLVYASE
jgi:transcriptional regulator with XRE-family HTH domain